MSILATILNTLVVILAVLLIALILVQPTKSGGGFGSAFGGLGESVFGAQAMSHLSKLTVWCISIFFVLTLASAIVAARIRPDSGSIAIGSGDSKTAQKADAKSKAPAQQKGDEKSDAGARQKDNPNSDAQTDGAAAPEAKGASEVEKTEPAETVETVQSEQTGPVESAQTTTGTPAGEPRN